MAGLLQAEFWESAAASPEELSVRFSEAGVSHLFAVSGLHCAFLLTLLSLLVGASAPAFGGSGHGSADILYVYGGANALGGSGMYHAVFPAAGAPAQADADPITSLAAALWLILLVNLCRSQREPAAQLWRHAGADPGHAPGLRVSGQGSSPGKACGQGMHFLTGTLSSHPGGYGLHRTADGLLFRRIFHSVAADKPGVYSLGLR